MSYDLELWSVHPFDSLALRDSRKWEHPDENQWIRSGASWQIVVFQSSKLLPEDIPDEIAQLLPGIKHLTSISLEGRRTNEAMQLLRSTSNHLARNLHGVILDQQEDTMVTPSGVKRFVSPSKHESEFFSVLSFQWWFLESPLVTYEGREHFLKLLERLLAEALPRRYGLYEPPQHIYAETGKTHLLQFMSDNINNFIVWYPHRPVTGFYLGHPKPVGASTLGFRTNRLEVEIECAVLTQPGWADNLRHFWREVSCLLNPIYGEVRTLGGRQRRGSTIYISHKTEAGLELTKAWWWRGVPKQLGCAVVLGEAYQKLWPAFLPKASIEDPLAFASTSDWSSGQDLSEIVGSPPNSIVMRPEASVPKQQEYPEQWPFGEPFDPPRPHPGPSIFRKFRGLFGAFLIALITPFPRNAFPQGPKWGESSLTIPLPYQGQGSEKPEWCKELPRPEYKKLERMKVSDAWFEVYKVAPETYAIYEPHQSEEVISYLILGKQKAILFDTGMGISDIRKVAEDLAKEGGLKRPLQLIVLNSHTHNDHVGDNWEFDTIYSMNTDFSQQNAKGSVADAQEEVTPGEICGELPKGFDPKTYRTKPWHISRYIHDGEKIDLGGRVIEILSTPGHTPDAITLFDRANGLLFTGDTYYPATIWLYRPETDFDAYAKSIERLARLEPQVSVVLGAHNVPVAPRTVLPALVQAFTNLRAGKATCKPDKPGRQVCTVDHFRFLVRAQ